MAVRAGRMLAVLALVALAACAREPEPAPISELIPGTILSAEAVTRGESATLADDAAGAWIGGSIGLVVGGAVGSSRHHGGYYRHGYHYGHHGGCCGGLAGALIGLAAGALVGAIVENAVEREAGTDYVIALDDGTEVIVFKSGETEFVPGQRIRLAIDDGADPRMFPA